MESGEHWEHVESGEHWEHVESGVHGENSENPPIQAIDHQHMKGDDPNEDTSSQNEGPSTSARGTRRSDRGAAGSNVSPSSFPIDDIISSLGDQYRRDLLHHLASSNVERVDVDTCASYVARQNADRTDDDVDLDRVTSSLYHVHLPRLERYDIVEWDRDAGHVSKGTRFSETMSVLELIEDRDAVERRNERLDRFAKVVTHDLRGPLFTASGYLDLAQREVDDETLTKARQALDRMEALIDDLQAIARGDSQASQTRPIDLASLAAECWQNVQTDEATLVTEAEGTIEANPGQCKQLLENLFRNAIEHGSATRSSQADDDPVETDRPHVTITVGDLEDGFYVTDDGSGIPRAVRREVFENGFSTTETGTGLGLSIVQQITRNHGWEVRVTEGTDGGARFEFTGVESG